MLREFPQESRKNERTLTKAYIQQSVVQGLKQLFGEVGASHPIVVESLNITDCGAVFILRCAAFYYSKVRSSITLLSTYHKEPCAFHVTRVGTNLLELFEARPTIVL